MKAEGRRLNQDECSYSSFLLLPLIYAGSSIGRAAVSKAAGCRFDSYPACFMASATKDEPRKEAMADDEQSSRDDRAESKGGGGGGGAVVAYRAADSGGFFTIHKRGQGYWTRMGTALGAALIAFLFAEFTWGRLKVLATVYHWPLNTWAMLGISLGVFAG